MLKPLRQLSKAKIVFLVLIMLVSACSGIKSQPQVFSTRTQVNFQEASPTVGPQQLSDETQATKPITNLADSTPTLTIEPYSELAFIPQPSISVASTPSPIEDWQLLPVIPVVTQKALAIYQDGISRGRNPHAFSKIGDCQSITTYFLSYFEQPGLYDLGPYPDLQETIDWYDGSFSRESLAVKGGFNAAAILSPLRADQTICKPNENPVACEFRVNNPSIALISLEEWWSGHPENYEKYMRQIIEYSIDQGVLPIVATKADNLEGNHLINQTIVKLAQEYDIPLWNFWSAVQPLPNHGLILKDSSGAPDMFHLTHRNNYFFNTTSIRRQSGWSVRNLTALQVLDSIRHGLIESP